MTDIGAARNIDSGAPGVDDAVVIVGYSGTTAVRWVNKKMQDLNELVAAHSGRRLEAATAIDHDGIIVVFRNDRGNDHVPFRLVPNE